MSDIEPQTTDILLPGASVSVFSKDKETLQSAASLLQDWRYSRVKVSSHEGDVDTAIQYFSQDGTTPELLIIQTEDVGDSFIEKLGELSQYCNEDTLAIIIGPVNDVYLYRKLIEMGVSDYLVKPITPDALSEVVAKALINKLGVSGSKLIAFLGAKGGIGTSTLAQLCALCATEKLGQRVLLLDASGGSSSLSVGMGFDSAASLRDLYKTIESNNEESLKRMLFKASEKLTVVAGGSDAILDSSISPEEFEAILDFFMAKFPVVIADLSGAEASLKRRVISRARQTIMVTTPTITSLRLARGLIKEISEVRGDNKGSMSLLVNMENLSRANEVTATDIKEALEYGISAVIPFAPNIFIKNESEIKSIMGDKEGSAMIETKILPFMSRFLSESGEIDENSDKNSGVIGGFLTKFKSK
ncbi:MAG: AAA family ATPase [Alphaproteobacteria bacterium]|nr:AAA family ATPase [Alphaproteobacteria bacterium]